MNPITAWWLRGAFIALVQLTALQSTALRAQGNGADTAAAAQSLAFEQATREFRQQRFPAAYGRFAKLADAGHVPSACIALLMVRDGRLLFRNDWYATPEQLRRWSAMTIEAARQPLQMQAGDG